MHMDSLPVEACCHALTSNHLHDLNLSDHVARHTRRFQVGWLRGVQTLVKLGSHAQRPVGCTRQMEPVGKPTVHRHSRRTTHAKLRRAARSCLQTTQHCEPLSSGKPHIAGSDEAVLSCRVVTSRNSGSHSATPASGMGAAAEAAAATAASCFSCCSNRDM